MSTVTLLIEDDAGTGVASIYTGDPADESPHTDPLSNLSRLKFHTALKYTKILSEHTVSITFPARTEFRTSPSSNWYLTGSAVTAASQTLFAHGRSGYPWVLASVEIDGQMVPFCGSVPVQQGLVYPSEDPCGWARWVTVGADDTNVICHEYTVIQRVNTGDRAEVIMPEITLDITVWVTDKILEA